ncbi:MAG TPA: ABC transporter permease [Symbiobacteriaceae bacterium]|jgi:peptide/nickel transport system permease protein
MLPYILRRLWAGIPVLIGVSLITFVLMHVVPGDPVVSMFSKRADVETIARIRHEMGLDRPLPVQYGDFVWDAVRGDLGSSFRSHEPVTGMIAHALPTTVRLTGSAALVMLFLGIPAGVLAALKRNSWIDYMSTVTTLSFISAPIFWVAIIAQIIFGLKLGWLPISGKDHALWLVMPALVLGTRYAASIARYTRSAMLEVLNQDYVRTARAKGLMERRVIMKHALKNALVPVLTVVGLEIGGLLTGSILTESVFGLPGVGLVTIDSIGARDFPVIQGTVLFTAVIYVIMNMLVDISYSLVDPRIRMS